MNLRGLLLALVYVLGLSAHHLAAAAGTDSPWRTAPTLDQMNRRAWAPPSLLPPGGDTVPRGWQMELARGVRAQPTSAVAALSRGGAPLQVAVNLAKSGGRVIGYGGLLQVGAIAVNAALSAALQRMQQDVSSVHNDLAECLRESNAAGITEFSHMICGKVTANVVFPHGEYPSSGTKTWWDFTNNNRVFNFRVQSRYNNGSDNYILTYTCGDTSSGPISANRYASSANVESEFLYYTRVCRGGTVSTPISLDTWRQGGTVNGTPIAPHPNIDQYVREEVARHFENMPPSTTGPNMWPGVSIANAPTINEYYGAPVEPWLDGDSDGWSDAEELARNSDPSDPNSKPDLNRDTDGDGVPDGLEDKYKTNPYDPKSKPDLNDMDGDGVPDETDPDIDGDGVPNESDPDPLDKTIPVKCATGYKTSLDGKSCLPEQSEEKCPEGQKLNDATPPKCVVDEEKKDDPVGDECGNFSIKRLTTHTAHYLRDLVAPCDDFSDLVKPITEQLQVKFPFSVAAGLKDWFKVQGDTSTAQQMPDSLSVIPLEWGWLTGLWSLIKTVVGVALYAWFGMWLLDRFTPRTSI